MEANNVMGKRYKAGNHGKTRNRPGRLYIEREAKINRLINQFRRILFNENNQRIKVYEKADHLRRQIKYLLDTQSKQIHTQSRKRRNIYYRQLADFKGLYVTWKKITLPTYLKVRFDFPTHLIPNLCEYYKAVMKHENPELIRYW